MAPSDVLEKRLLSMPILLLDTYIFNVESVKGFCFVHERKCVILRTHVMRYARIIAELTNFMLYQFFAIGPLHNPVAWYGIILGHDNAVGLPKQRNSYQSSPTFVSAKRLSASL